MWSNKLHSMQFLCKTSFRFHLLLIIISQELKAILSEPEKLAFMFLEDFKRNFRAPGETTTTEDQCRRRGLAFLPMVLEAHGGGFGKVAQNTLKTVASAGAAVWSEAVDAVSLRIAQRMSMILHRENARAILRRRQVPEAMPVIEEVPIDGRMNIT